MRIPMLTNYAAMPGGLPNAVAQANNALLASTYQNQVQQAAGQYAPQMQQAQIASLRISPIAQVLGNPYLSSTMDANTRSTLLNALLSGVETGGGSAGTASMPGNNNGVVNNLNPGVNSAAPTNAFAAPPVNPNSPNNINAHVIAQTGGTANAPLVSGAQQNIADVNNLQALLGTAQNPGPLGKQLMAGGNVGDFFSQIFPDVNTQGYNATTAAIAKINSLYPNLMTVPALGTGQSGQSVFNNALTQLNALKQKYLPQQAANIVAGQTGNVRPNNSSMPISNTPLGYKNVDEFTTNYMNMQNNSAQRSQLLQNFAAQEYDADHGVGAWNNATPQQKTQQLILMDKLARVPGQ